jgi:F-type H+-transporting ATPase subunit gamma
MAGNYNINTFKKIKENIKTNDKIIVFGERGYKFVKKETMKYEDTLNIKTEEKHFAFFEYKYVSDYIARLYLLNKIGSLSLIYTKYKDNKIKTDVVEVLPITKEFNEQNKNEVLYNFEQDTKHIFKKILPFYLESIIYSALIESKLSENIARKNAMVEANNNIEENIRELSIKYNKKRQEKITSESERRVNND